MDLTFDRQHIWHPYTSLNNPLPTYPVVRAEGVHLVLEDGQPLIDGMSSWWTAIHGYNHPEINVAANKQLRQMSHVMFGGIIHQPAIKLCKKLTELTAEGLEKVFLCDSGSVSVEVAMKMAIQYQHAKGKPRGRFMTLARGYHGDTTGAMAVCDPNNGMHHLFADFLPKHYFFQIPEYGFHTSPSKLQLHTLECFFERYAIHSAAFILEPIVQGAGGMNFYSPKWLANIRSLCDQFEILLIADEIATGFGRSGKFFACEYAEVVPDILCVGKALTGGYMSLAATLCSEQVSTTICHGEAGVLMHGPTFMGNPLACAVASKSLELLVTSNWQQKIDRMEKNLSFHLAEASTLATVKEVRVLGGMGVVELHAPVEVAEAQKFFVEQGVWIRPFRNLIYLMPPYIIDDDALEKLCKSIISYISTL